MSLILDALNRSRQESDAVPGLATQHYQPPASEHRRGWRRWLPWVALAAAILVIAWLLLDRGRDETDPSTPARPGPVQQPAPSAPAAVAPEPRPAPAPAAAPRPQPPRPQAAQVAPAPKAAAVPSQAVASPPGDPAVSALYERSAAAGAASAAKPVDSPAAAAGAQPAPVPEAAPPSVAGSQPGTSRQVREEPVDIEALVTQAREEMENAQLAEHPAPFIIDLSQQTKDGIPTLLYQRHDYRGDSASSTVVLNGQQLRVGGRPAPGVRVEEILPDSVVLSHQGTQFRLRALNSWVNL